MIKVIKENLNSDLQDVWEYGIDDAIEENADYIDFTVISKEDLRSECLEYIKYCFENDMISLEPDYNNIVIDTARNYDAWND